MRRGISILLALLVGMGPMLWPLNGKDEQHLPACCRRNGVHHCAMSAQMAAFVVSGEKAFVTAPLTCPYFPHVNAAVILSAWLLPGAAARMPEPAIAARVPLPPDSNSFFGLSSTYSGRGPPAHS